MNLMKIDLAEVEIRVMADVVRTRRRQKIKRIAIELFVTLVIGILCVLFALLSGCVELTGDRVVVKPRTIKFDTGSRKFRTMLAVLIKNRYETEPRQDVNWILADLYLAAYEAGID